MRLWDSPDREAEAVRTRRDAGVALSFASARRPTAKLSPRLISRAAPLYPRPRPPPRLSSPHPAPTGRAFPSPPRRRPSASRRCRRGEGGAAAAPVTGRSGNGGLEVAMGNGRKSHERGSGFVQSRISSRGDVREFSKPRRRSIPAPSSAGWSGGGWPVMDYAIPREFFSSPVSCSPSSPSGRVATLAPGDPRESASRCRCWSWRSRPPTRGSRSTSSTASARPGEAILEGRNPVNSGWHFLPAIPYVYGSLMWLGIPWEVAGRLVTVVADLALIPLVGKLAGRGAGRLRAFQYACNPLAILVASVHGQVEPVSLVFAVAAYVVARGPGEFEGVSRCSTGPTGWCAACSPATRRGDEKGGLRRDAHGAGALRQELAGDPGAGHADVPARRARARIMQRGCRWPFRRSWCC